MKPSQSVFVECRGLRHHVRTWGEPGDPVLVLLHGWMDMSASFQFLVDALAQPRRVLAPDWRGFGLTQWDPSGYWFPDYLADLEGLLDALAPDQAVDIAGHSMGANVAGLYAGIRPDRVRRLALVEGFGMARSRPASAPGRYARWLDEQREAPTLRDYADLDEVAARLQSNNPRLGAERARALAPHWAQRTPGGRYVLRADPRHKQVNPVLYRLEEAMACWQRISAPVLWIWGDTPYVRDWLKEDDAALDERRAAFASLTELTLADAGHMVHHDQPQALARALEDFLAG